MEELIEEIATTESDSEREELQQTLRVCQEIIYAVEEGFICFEEDDDEELHFYPESECYHSEAI